MIDPDYTPTTQDMRIAWFVRTGDDAAFYRWLNELRADVYEEGFIDGERQGGEGDDGPRYVNPYLKKDN